LMHDKLASNYVGQVGRG